MVRVSPERAPFLLSRLMMHLFTLAGSDNRIGIICLTNRLVGFPRPEPAEYARQLGTNRIERWYEEQADEERKGDCRTHGHHHRFQHLRLN